MSTQGYPSQPERGTCVVGGDWWEVSNLPSPLGARGPSQKLCLLSLQPVIVTTFPVGYPVGGVDSSLHSAALHTLRLPRLHRVLIGASDAPQVRESVMIALGWNLARGQSERLSRENIRAKRGPRGCTLRTRSHSLDHLFVVQRVLSVDCYRSMSIELSLEMNAPLGISTTYRLASCWCLVHKKSSTRVLRVELFYRVVMRSIHSLLQQGTSRSPAERA